MSQVAGTDMASREVQSHAQYSKTCNRESEPESGSPRRERSDKHSERTITSQAAPLSPLLPGNMESFSGSSPDKTSLKGSAKCLGPEQDATFDGGIQNEGLNGLESVANLMHHSNWRLEQIYEHSFGADTENVADQALVGTNEFAQKSNRYALEVAASSTPGTPSSNKSVFAKIGEEDWQSNSKSCISEAESMLSSTHDRQTDVQECSQNPVTTRYPSPVDKHMEVRPQAKNESISLTTPSSTIIQTQTSGSRSDSEEFKIHDDFAADQNLNLREQTPETKVDADEADVIGNPLSKSERYTVIKGRLPDTDPYMRAANNLGVKLISKELSRESQLFQVDPSLVESRRRSFLKDVEAFNRELDREFKVPVIGGGQLDLYELTLAVLRLGGLRNVVLNRAFRIVGQQLDLPRSCTSAAFVLKGAYERLLYLYEQKIAFDIDPVNPAKTIDMKSIVSESRKELEQRSGSRRSRKGRQVSGQSLKGKITKSAAQNSLAQFDKLKYGPLQRSVACFRDANMSKAFVGDFAPESGSPLAYHQRSLPDDTFQPRLDISHELQNHESATPYVITGFLPDEVNRYTVWSHQDNNCIGLNGDLNGMIQLATLRPNIEHDPFYSEPCYNVTPPRGTWMIPFYVNDVTSSELTQMDLGVI